MLLLLVMTAVFFSLYSETSDTFATWGNFQAVVSNQAVIAIVALGALIPLLCNEWDLSVGATAGLSSVFVASSLGSGISLSVAVLIGIALGAVIGLVNGLIITRAGVSAVITTLGMATIVDGIVNQKTGGLASNTNIPESLINFGSGNWLGVPCVAYALLAVVLGVVYVVSHTPVGRYLYALGSNPTGARLVGLRTKLLLGSTFVAAGTLSGIAGVLQVARAGGAAPEVGDNFTLPALAAAFLSAAAIRPGRYNVPGTLVAIFFLATLNSGLNLAGAPLYISNYVNGGALIIGVALAAYLGRKRSGRGD
jgi:ribose transport system permease protein